MNWWFQEELGFLTGAEIRERSWGSSDLGSQSGHWASYFISVWPILPLKVLYLPPNLMLVFIPYWVENVCGKVGIQGHKTKSQFDPGFGCSVTGPAYKRSAALAIWQRKYSQNYQRHQSYTDTGRQISWCPKDEKFLLNSMSFWQVVFFRES